MDVLENDDGTYQPLGPSECKEIQGQNSTVMSDSLPTNEINKAIGTGK